MGLAGWRVEIRPAGWVCAGGGVKVLRGSGCGSEGYGVAEGFELADVSAFFGIGVDAAAEVVGAEIVVGGFGVAEQVPDDDEDGVSDGYDGAFLASSPGDPSVTFAQESVRSACSDRCLSQGAGQVAVAVSG